MKIFKLTTWIGILMLIGTAGSADLGNIGFSQTILQITAGVLIAGTSYFMYVLTYKPKLKLKRKKIIPIESLRKVG